jgi:hypothetical protein
MFQVINKQFGTSPVVIHAHGSHDHKPNWPPIKNAFFATPQLGILVEVHW